MRHVVRAEPVLQTSEPPRIRAYQRRAWLSRVLSTAVALFAVASTAWFLTNPNLGWSVVWDYLFSRPILAGLVATLELSIISMVIGIMLGVLFALAGRSRYLALRTIAGFYIWLFRGVPLLVQLLFWYNVGILVPGINFYLPFTDQSHYISANAVISGFTASILGLALNEGAYMTEIVRAGIISVPRGQLDAALSIGFTSARAMRTIILPQTVRVIIPPTGNEFIGMVKSSALVAVIGGGDLLYKAQIIYGQNFEVIPLLVVVSIWYLVITSLATLGQGILERRVAGGDTPRISRWSKARGPR
jgi:polar amino acid transport system permease protein